MKDRRTRRLQAAGDDGFALLTVLGSMVVITLFVLSTLAYAMQNAPASREDQDSKAAIAAAQAGIEEFTARLNVDDTYYANTAAHATNPAFTAAGREVPGTAGLARFRYELLSTALSTSQEGVIRLRVTGMSRDVRRDVVATLAPDGFLKYIYFTDLENLDPVLYGSALPASHNGLWTKSVSKQMGNGNGNGTMATFNRTWYVPSATVEAVCKRYWYAGRSVPTHTAVIAFVEVDTHPTGDYPTTSATRTASTAEQIGFICPEIAFVGDDVIDGPLHSNDALQINGPVRFKKLAGTSWGTTATVPQPTDGKLWWGTKTVTLPEQSPQFVPVVQLPSSNGTLKQKADPLIPGNDSGCLYTGHTTIRFQGTKMWVRSPGTTSTVARCYDPANPNTEQLVDVPSVVYVQGGTVCGPSPLTFPFPKRNSSGVSLEAAGPTTTEYDCSFGNAFVSGELSGRVTVGSSHDIIITGNTTYQGGLTGTDALGLIPQGFAWVYKPVRADGTNLLPSTDAVRRIDAAILSVDHSFVVQNYNKGAPLSTAADPNSYLTVRGSIIQKHRGTVGQGGTTPNGYLKNYIYDQRLLNAPPPFFLRPVSSPWKVTKVTD